MHSTYFQFGVRIGESVALKNTTLGYIYNTNTEQENLDVMNKALKKSDRKNKK
ncbi:hypothetical protein bsdcttw_37700 [Anaerocolumna chitinilytica]|uniref:Uncharacterized protein n=1 Tax=Anaerocolumna chitinilytica TaxID=1727145 RepID=A0A7I8DQR7_9FIRM|nr:hypothetical protein bsdcttw_37700 [Anaerocolumna chitinilytica]